MKQEENTKTKINQYTITFFGKRYEQLERLSKNKKSKMLIITTALDLLEKAKNI
jgi:hypothetical protein